MKNIRIAFWAVLALLTALWIAANLLFPETLRFNYTRNLILQYSGVLSIGAMSITMILATRAKWLDPLLNGLDKAYRLHKWLGVSALVAAVVHWIAAVGPKWMVDLGVIDRLRRGKGPHGGRTDLGGLHEFVHSQRDLAETIGEWAFYAAVLLIAIALIKRIPYKFFVSTHALLAVVYLALTAHSVIMLKFSAWPQPLGVVVGLLMAGGVVSALLALTKQIGRGNRATGNIETVRTFPEVDATEVNILLNEGWSGHDAGQFAFVTFDRREGKHPFTIASAWDPATRRITFITKGLGDYTDFLPQTLKIGGETLVEGPYGRFTFDDDRDRQIWIGGGIGITPFIARMKQLVRTSEPRDIDLIHCTKEFSPEAMDLLKADAKAAGITLHVLVDDKDGLLTGERLRELVPDWLSASVWFCGPDAMGEALRRDLVAHNLDNDDFHHELFNMR